MWPTHVLLVVAARAFVANRWQVPIGQKDDILPATLVE